MSHYKLSKNANTELWVNINFVRTPTRTTSHYKLSKNANTELRVNIN